MATVKKLCVKHRQHFAYSSLRTNLNLATIFTFDALFRDLFTDNAGRCSHHNASVYLALVYLGFNVHLIKASMANPDNNLVPREIPAHLAIILMLNDQRYLVDPGGYALFTVLKFPFNNMKNSSASENSSNYRVVERPAETLRFALQFQARKLWHNLHFFSTDPIEISDLNPSLHYLNSPENPNHYNIVILMFHRGSLYCLRDRDIKITRPLSKVYIEQPSIHYALTTFGQVNTKFFEVSNIAQSLLSEHGLESDYLADKVRFSYR
ncbi:MAG: arylamine N-acetyltransferase [Gammaproteobacteria bacterium]|nr:arylamine N-acetyltransferase [Gammaproteobacteria bacterium]